MTSDQLFRSIKAGDIRSAYVFYGPEVYVRDRAVAALRQKLPDTQIIALLDSDSLEARIQGAGENGIEQYIVDNPALS